MAEYATFRPVPGEAPLGQVTVGTGSMDVGMYFSLWILGGLLTGIPLGVLYLLALCKGWI